MQSHMTINTRTCQLALHALCTFHSVHDYARQLGSCSLAAAVWHRVDLSSGCTLGVELSWPCQRITSLSRSSRPVCCFLFCSKSLTVVVQDETPSRSCSQSGSSYGSSSSSPLFYPTPTRMAGTGWWIHHG